MCVCVCVYLTLPQFSALAEGTGSSRAALSHYFPHKKGTEMAVTGCSCEKKETKKKKKNGVKVLSAILCTVVQLGL